MNGRNQLYTNGYACSIRTVVMNGDLYLLGKDIAELMLNVNESNLNTEQHYNYDILNSNQSVNGQYEKSTMNIAENIRKFRVATGLSQADLADKVGVSPPMINFIESGTKIPSLRLSLDIADVLNTTVDELCKGV